MNQYERLMEIIAEADEISDDQQSDGEATGSSDGDGQSLQSNVYSHSLSHWSIRAILFGAPGVARQRIPKYSFRCSTVRWLVFISHICGWPSFSHHSNSNRVHSLRSAYLESDSETYWIEWINRWFIEIPVQDIQHRQSMLSFIESSQQHIHLARRIAMHKQYISNNRCVAMELQQKLIFWTYCL